MPPVRAAIYARLSIDPKGEGVAVDRQLADCREMAKKRGWEVVAEFRDDSRSAWRRDRKRPGWDALLDGIKSDEFDAVVVWHGDRLVRQPYDLEQLIRLVEDKGLMIASLAGERDLGKADDRFVVRIEVAAQCRESDSTARRVRRVREQEALDGKRHGRVPFGWRTPEEAGVVRRIVGGLLSGTSLRTLTNALNTEGIPSPGGKVWTGTQVRQVAERWSNAGKRTRRGQIVADGEWAALVSEADQEAVIRLLRDPSRRTNGGTLRKHLLAGIAVCAVCNSPLRSITYRQPGRTPRDIYRCLAGMHVSVGEAWLDSFVLDLAQANIDLEGVRPSNNGAETEARSTLASLRARKQEAAENFADGAIDAEQLRTITKRLDPKIKEAEAALLAAEKRSQVAPDTVLRNLDMEHQRIALRVLFDRIEVDRAARRGQADFERIEVAWA